MRINEGNFAFVTLRYKERVGISWDKSTAVYHIQACCGPSEATKVDAGIRSPWGMDVSPLIEHNFTCLLVVQTYLRKQPTLSSSLLSFRHSSIFLTSFLISLKCCRIQARLRMLLKRKVQTMSSIVMQQRPASKRPPAITPPQKCMKYWISHAETKVITDWVQVLGIQHRLRY